MYGLSHESFVKVLQIWKLYEEKATLSEEEKRGAITYVGACVDETGILREVNLYWKDRRIVGGCGKKGHSVQRMPHPISIRVEGFKAKNGLYNLTLFETYLN